MLQFKTAIYNRIP